MSSEPVSDGSSPLPGEVPRLIGALERGEAGASESLFPLVYDELRALAGAFFRGRPQSTLQPTAVVHEAYLKLMNGSGQGIGGQEHFFALAARAMRQVLVDHARRGGSDKRGGAWQRVSLSGAADSAAAGLGGWDAQLVDLENALAKLEGENERQARVVELRYFAGLSVPEAAKALGVSERTVKNDWRFARAWLRAELADGDGSTPNP